MTKCYGHEECEYNGQPECRLPDGMECPHGVKADKPVAESKTDIEALIERLNQYSQSLIACQMGGEFSDVCVDAATALSTLQAENEKLRAGLERVTAERDAAVKKYEAEKEDFLDYALSGTQNAAPFCRNRNPDCVDKRGWCIPVKCHGFIRDKED